jgi:hypothetical protein
MGFFVPSYWRAGQFLAGLVHLRMKMVIAAGQITAKAVNKTNKLNQ